MKTFYVNTHTPEQKAHLAEWIAALRSGAYKQGTGMLRNIDNNFCCLGVACDLSKISQWNEGDDDPNSYNYLGLSGTTAAKVNAYFGINSSISGKLINMNDGVAGEKANTFAEIADFLENEVLGENPTR